MSDDQQPVAWRYRYVRANGKVHWILTQSRMNSQPASKNSAEVIAEPLYAAPVSAPLDREGVARIIDPRAFKPTIFSSDPDWHPGDDNLRRINALTKADAILALTGQQDQVGLTTPAVLGEPSADTLRSGERKVLLAEIADLKQSVIAFCGPWAATYARDFGLPKDHLHPTHYDLLERCGARMVDFTRADLPEPPPPAGGVK